MRTAGLDGINGTLQSRVIAILKQHPEKSDRSIAIDIGCGRTIVRTLRVTLEESNVIPRLDYAIDSHGIPHPNKRSQKVGAYHARITEDERSHVTRLLQEDPIPSIETIIKRTGVGRWTVERMRLAYLREHSTALPKNSPRHRVAARVRDLIERGYNIGQIAEITGRHTKVIAQTVRDFNIPNPNATHRHNFGVAKISPAKVIRETVDTIAATVHGLDLIEDRTMDMNADEAAALLHDLKAATKVIKRVMEALQETMNG